jgi:hypothetical protein
MSFKVEGDIDKLHTLSEASDGFLREAVVEGSLYGERRMGEIVPHGQTHKLQDAVEMIPLSIIGPGHYRGGVWVNPAIAPHAGYVNKGTGIDGPFHRPVSITRPSRKNPNKPGYMRFQKEGEPVRFKQVVKYRPSSKIERGKNFSGRTYEDMKRWAFLRAHFIGDQIIAHLRK